jgi:hypothetical protein
MRREQQFVSDGDPGRLVLDVLCDLSGRDGQALLSCAD